ncbi:mitogen-activated protein kinase kinase kinase 20-like [Vigna umbellata]|uniref:mitogen-activated protein kinase kinase kinase 20-like n=1 Tax=Vigna umbellata TaxID=87088 RepID=UPI001F5FA8FB|nr:mitogen-activated protein kinase kinase kinase 20-like [Vigna umbellata]
MDWVRGDAVGRGGFATVSLVIPTTNPSRFPSLTAVKSSQTLTSCWLKNEKHVLDHLGSCPRIIRCFGDDYSFENGVEYYNLFLEYATAGSLADEVNNCGGRIPEPQVRRYTRSIVEGLNHIHQNGFVHCDIKLQNILVLDDGEIKIADFGLAKEAGEIKQRKSECRGTPLFMSPEQVIDGECESPADIWALGCAVVEMVTGKPAWKVEKGSSMWSLMLRIGVGEETPEIPENLSIEGKDFIGKCFVKDPRKRWSAEMLLKHPFVSDGTVSFKRVHESPRSHFDFPDWVSSTTSSLPSSPESQSPWNFDESRSEGFCSPEDRLRQISTVDRPANWSESDGWSSVR